MPERAVNYKSHMKVLKFGGTSVGSNENIKRIIGIVRKEKEQGEEVVLVCSAFSKVTDQLINAGKLAEKKDNNTYLEIFDSFRERHRLAIEELITDYEVKKVMLEEFIESMARVEDILKGINMLGELSDKTLAQLVSFGERFSAFIVAGALKSAGLNGIYVNATKLVRTDSNFLAAKVNFEKTNKSILDFFETVNGIAVVTGFIGYDEHSNVTTLGRGGSDYTAAIFRCRAESRCHRNLDRCGRCIDSRSSKSGTGVHYTNFILQRSDGIVALRSQGDLSAKHSAGLYQKYSADY
jgi:aspartokinase/homoserine dehydrogenase 1